MPSERQRKTKDPCSICSLHKERCLCHLLVPLTLRTRVLLMIHAKELKRTTNTGRLAVHALTNSALFIRGQREGALSLGPFLDGEYEKLLLYPGEGATELKADWVRLLRKPVLLIVPDGNWRQAGKVAARHPELANVTRVKLKRAQPSASLSVPPAVRNLRRENSPDGMATLEAIAEALDVLEGEAASAPLRALYREKLERTLRGRGLAPG